MGGCRHATQAAQTLTTIERHRWHTELVPVFEPSCTSSGDGGRATLRLTLAGPSGLDRLDEVAVYIRDDTDDHSSNLAGGPTTEQVAQQVWGPYRFVAGVDGADETGRRVSPVKLLLGDDRPFALGRTPRPPWGSGTGDWWERRYFGSSLRLTLHCWREGHEPWTVPIEVPPMPARPRV